MRLKRGFRCVDDHFLIHYLACLDFLGSSFGALLYRSNGTARYSSLVFFANTGRRGSSKG